MIFARLLTWVIFYYFCFLKEFYTPPPNSISDDGELTFHDPTVPFSSLAPAGSLYHCRTACFCISTANISVALLFEQMATDPPSFLSPFRCIRTPSWTKGSWIKKVKSKPCFEVQPMKIRTGGRKFSLILHP